MIGCFSMQERLVGLDLHRSRLALAACDASLLQPLLGHAEAHLGEPQKDPLPQPASRILLSCLVR